MISYEQALQQVILNARSFGKELVCLDDALGRTLAELVYADRDYPPFNRSAMDGIAINFEDFKAGIREYKIAETIYAGQTCPISLQPGSCYKIMTGAAVPPSANAVIRDEDIRVNGWQVTVNTNECNVYKNIEPRGNDLSKDRLALNRYTIITHTTIGLLAALGKHQIWTEKLPLVYVFTTGNEVIQVNEEPSEVQIRNSNQYLLRSLLGKKVGFCHFEHINDDKDVLKNALSRGMHADIMIINGGVSTGDADFIPGVLQSLGIEILFHKVAIKPGKPVLCGKMPAGGMVFALPGNPYSCLVTFKLFIEAYLCSCFGSVPVIQRFPFSGTRKKKSFFDEFFPVRLNRNSGWIEPVQINGPGDIRLAFKADGFAKHPAENNSLSDGEMLVYYNLT